MKMKNKNIIQSITWLLMIILLAAVCLNAQVEMDNKLPEIVLSEDKGGEVHGNEWKSSDLKNKLNLILYVAPNQQEDVEPLLNKIDGAGYSDENLNITLIINTEATWIPNSIIEGKVKGRAEEDKSKTYVLDKDEVLLKNWRLSEENPNIILVNKAGNVIYYFNEKLNEDFEKKLFRTIDNEIRKGGDPK